MCECKKNDKYQVWTSSPLPFPDQQDIQVKVLDSDHGDNDWLWRHGSSNLDGKDRCLLLLRFSSEATSQMY